MSGEVVIALGLVQEGIDGAVLFVVSETERIVEYLGWECQHASMLLPSEEISRGAKSKKRGTLLTNATS